MYETAPLAAVGCFCFCQVRCCLRLPLVKAGSDLLAAFELVLACPASMAE